MPSYLSNKPTRLDGQPSYHTENAEFLLKDFHLLKGRNKKELRGKEGDSRKLIIRFMRIS